MESKKIGFIGTGVMGASIVMHLLNAGHDVTIYTRTKSKAADLISAGAKWAETPAEASKEQEIIFTMVGYPKDVEEVYIGEKGIFSAAKEGAIVIDMTTSEPTLAKKLYHEARERGLHSLDAPVSGGDIGAKNGTLSLMIGGDKDVFEKLYPIFELFGQNIVYQGVAGSGQHTKMCNQIAIASGMIGVCESMAYGLKAGLTMEEVLRSITAGAAGSWSLSNLAPRMLKGNLEPGFYIKHIIKDIKIALDEAERMNLQLPGLTLAKSMYDQLLAEGYGDNGTQALIKYYE
ncbi:NAD(P)-dependent oxidoreductase [Solibacillus sp. FSL W7-1472]|uniref:2-hydroxy-3-oxopropionate reductase n=1 Tax=Solibacillus isronensis B3W22 TaxID=1224748 RepID=K1KSB3_9BACL|nr:MULTISPECIES: NAD(P)-dependent oxidoreductase [Solibacillus]AMO84507.1 oxidoreductase [Solibacillus silvestris]EKB47055.1 2-hydroxy-3-oxopropionate reductase [Solibacillus isronensis B3W22]OBW58704.1 oxidoreductase [Solibacillus silvestris]